MYQKELVEELEGKPVVKYGIDWRRSEAVQVGEVAILLSMLGHCLSQTGTLYDSVFTTWIS